MPLERPCPQCGALVVWIAPWGWFDVEGKQGKHRCETPLVEIPLQRACARCDQLIETYEDGRRLNLDGSAHECREQAPARAAMGGNLADAPIPATAGRGATLQPPKAAAPRPPVTTKRTRRAVRE